jgi:hypothetical protein
MSLVDFTTPVFSWSMIETSLAVVSANLPLLRPLLHRITGSCSYIWSIVQSNTPSHPEREAQAASDLELQVRKDEDSVRSRFSFEMLPPRRQQIGSSFNASFDSSASLASS